MNIIEKVACIPEVEMIKISKGDLKLNFCNYGASILSLSFGNICELLSLRNISDFLNQRTFIGNSVGRVAGRIENGMFMLEGKKIKLTNNDGLHHLHGGGVGFDNSLWKYTVSEREDSVVIDFFRNFSDGEEGYPGNLNVHIIYKVYTNSTMTIEYEAISDKTTIFNPTTHLYFNLGEGIEPNILNHYLKVPVIGMGEVDEEFVPTGKIKKRGKFISQIANGDRIKNLMKLIEDEYGVEGINHPFNIDKSKDVSLEFNNRKVIFNSDRNLVIYTGDHFDGKLLNESGLKIEKNAGIALEFQKFPDAINHPEFDDISIRANKKYRFKTCIRFE